MGWACESVKQGCAIWIGWMHDWLFQYQQKLHSNGHGCYLKKCYYPNLWIIHVQSFTNLPKSMWKFVFNVMDVIF